MNFIEFIGFIISMVAFVLLMFKQAREARQRKNLPEEEAGNENPQTEEAALHDLLQVLNIQQKPHTPSVVDPVLPPPPLPPPPPEESQTTKTKPEKPKFFDPHQKAYNTPLKTHPKKNLFNKVSLKDAIILSILLGPPKGQ